MVDSSAILNGNSLSVFAVNRNPNESVELAIRPGAGQIVSVRNADIVTGTDPNAANSYENPNVVTRQPFDQFTVANGTATTVLPPLSVVAVTFEFAA
jgi:alpha-N-arabinofuranosidase